jgi:hypothetical protein
VVLLEKKRYWQSSTKINVNPPLKTTLNSVVKNPLKEYTSRKNSQR